jgi:fluoride ion exporter CrcB/FEX
MNARGRVLLVGCGGALGGALRFAFVGHSPTAAPMLLAVNLSGSLLAGFVLGLLARDARAAAGERDRESVEAFLVAGFCGGFTSYSAFVALAGASGAIAAATLLGAPLAALAGMRLSGGYPAPPAEPSPPRGPQDSAS